MALGAAIGLAFGSAPFFSAAFALLGASWMKAFGWSAQDVALGATLFLATQTVGFPVAGRLLDRFGARRVASASIALFGALLIGLSLLGGSLDVFYALLVLMGLTSAATNFIGYARVLSTWFDRNRGLAIGLAASAQAVGLVSIPPVTQRLSEAAGWPVALQALGCFELLVCLPAVLLLVRERPGSAGAVASRSLGPGTPAKGAVLGDAIRDPVFWRLLACIAMEGLTIYAILPNTVLILGRTGLGTPEIAGLGTPEIAGIVSLAGAAFLVGRIVFGALLDRVRARWLFLLLVGLIACGLLAYASAGSTGTLRAGAVLLGAAGGGQTDLMPYVASRYFGTRTMSSVFGVLLFGFFAGAAIGPVLFVSASAAVGLSQVLVALAVLQIVPALIFFTLRDYPRSDPT